jgi:hypothetical protein
MAEDKKRQGKESTTETRGGTHEQHVAAGKQSHKNDEKDTHKSSSK